MKKLDLILVIDDDPTSLFITERRLNKIGLAEKVITSSQAEVALNHIKEYCGRAEYEVDCPSLILVDIMMPEMNGFEFVKAVQELPLTRKPILAMLTTSIHQSDMKIATELGVAGYLTKPLDEDSLMEFISQVLPE